VKIYGNLICQNAISEIARCIESVYPVVDEYFVLDGGSTDGTWEWLNKWKDVYHLTLFQNPYKDQGDQRNLLLSKIPKGVWVVNIDQDERLGLTIQCELRNFIERISPAVYDDPKRILPLTISTICVNLVKDLNHFDNKNVNTFATKIFYNDRNINFTNGYHTTIRYGDIELEHTNSLPVPRDWVIKHFAYLNPDRIKTSFKDPKRLYHKEEWDKKNWNVTEVPPVWL